MVCGVGFSVSESVSEEEFNSSRKVLDTSTPLISEIACSRGFGPSVRGVNPSQSWSGSCFSSPEDRPSNKSCTSTTSPLSLFSAELY